MNWELLWLFIVLNVLNVIIQTVKSIATIKCGKWMASVVNAVAYGLYTIVVVYTVCDLNLWLKVGVVAVANLIGVFFVKLFEEKARKDKLWKVEATVSPDKVVDISRALEQGKVPYNCFSTSGEHRIFNIFCSTQKESMLVKKLLDFHNAKYFVSESKTL
jgi:uncharacterized protein YebE (UPF0316 family)